MSLTTGSTKANPTSDYYKSVDGLSSNWSLSPAISDVNFSDCNILNAHSVQIDSQTLTATATDLLLNGVAIATIPSISNLTQWALYPSISGLVMDGFEITTCANITTSGLTLSGSVISLGGNALLVGGVDQTASFANFGCIADLNVSGKRILNCSDATIGGNVVSTSGNNILVNGINPITAWSSFGAGCNVDMSHNSIVNCSALNLSALVLDGRTITAAGNSIFVQGINPVSGWSTEPAISAVNLNFNSMCNLNVLSAPANLAINTGGALNLVGNGNIQGNLGLTQFLTQTYSSAPSSNVFGNSVQIGGQGLLAIPAGLVVNGPCTFDGGLTNGTSIGCLPALGVNTQRIDVLPIGIDIFSATFLTMNILGATNLVAGGATAIGAGSYITLEHGNGIGSNAVFVQNAARNSNALMSFDFGGNISGARINALAIHGSGDSVNVGFEAGLTGQLNGTCAVGRDAGRLNQGLYSVAVGYGAGQISQGSNSIAIGAQAGNSNLQPSTICINACANAFNPVGTGFFVQPVRNAMSNSSLPMMYDASLNEITYNLPPYLQIVVAEPSGIAPSSTVLTPVLRGITYAYIGAVVKIQNFDTTAITAGLSGFYVNLRNNSSYVVDVDIDGVPLDSVAIGGRVILIFDGTVWSFQ